jgi:hypothetical protein
MFDLCKTGSARVVSVSGGWPLSAVASCRGQAFAGSRLGVQFVDCTALLVLAVIRCFGVADLLNEGLRGMGGRDWISRRCAFWAEHETAHETHAG